ncbi:MAG: right-handed parallel beta-helix repeat-containing protein, partial [Candidatus Pacebacteria bacterium]|nr:right-handed parallel beta-helix repeat-containing protein [Candidatus Paceibacterota bacterium]
YVDGTKYTQDSPGIQNALDDLPTTGGKVILPEGTYNVDRAMDVCLADDGGSFTDETIVCNNDTVNNMNLLPATPVVGDAYYFGYDYRTRKVGVNIGTQGAGTWTITWEYYNGSAWTALSGVTDGTTGFTATTGEKNITYTLPTNWAKTTVNSTEKYYIRARVSAYTSITTQPLGTQAYGTGSITIDKSYVTLEGVGDSSKLYLSDGAGVDMIIMGSWSSSYNSIVISNLQIDGNKANQTSNVSGLYIYRYITKSTIENIYIHDCYYYGISLPAGANENLITKSRIYSNNEDGIRFDGGNVRGNNIFSHNTLSLNGGTGITIYRTFGNTIDGNIIKSNDSGISIYAAYKNTVIGNIVDSNVYDGISLWSSNNSVDNNTVIGNEISLNGRYGIAIDGADYNIIKGNIVKDNSQSSNNGYSEISFYGSYSGTYNIIEGNTIQSTQANKAKYGINEGSAVNNDYNSIMGNIISGPVTADILAQGPHTTVAGNKTSDATEGLFDISSNTGATQSALTVTQSGTGNIINLTGDSITTGTGMALSVDGLTTGTGFDIASTSTALTSGRLLSIDWTADATATGDLVRINIGPNGTIGNLFNITDNGTSLFSVSETAITS